MMGKNKMRPAEGIAGNESEEPAGKLYNKN
jgi:hypothetical protein